MVSSYKRIDDRRVTRKLVICALAYRRGRRAAASWNHLHCTHKEHIMGKYFLAWIMGVPAIVLVLLYFFFH
jgi:hypothetical protein